MKFMVMTDEHVADAVASQLIEKGVDAIRLPDVLPKGTPDHKVLEFAHRNGYALVTLDKRIESHILLRANEGKTHSGVFIGINLQGLKQIGVLVNELVFYDQAIKSGAATVEDDVYNKVIYIS